MTIDTEIETLEQAKRYFISMGCSGFHMMRENPQRFDEYKALDIDPNIESEWIKEEFENKIEYFNTNPTNEYGHLLRSLDSMIEPKEFYLEKLLELVIKIKDRIPLDQIEYVLSTIIGNNGTKSKGGLIQKSYDLKRPDLANKFYAQTKLLLKKTEENSITLNSVRGYLIDVIDYYRIEESKEFIIDLREKSYSDQFNYFKDGAEEGNKYSMKMLSDCYKEGKGCITDIDKSKYWEQRAKE
ncbi:MULTISPECIES: hypothetical protein [Flavobacterium]|uniref:hypothetical protein n=1 Tax=Flavobacterium TaxID=237 RepID=UPI0022AC901D|nr:MULTISPECIES: hypothetical protein [Flavobacterium]